MYWLQQPQREKGMMNIKLMRNFCLMLFASSAVSLAQVQEAGPATNGGNDHQPPAALESSPKSPIGMPAEPLRVVCKGNELTVAANNSTLGSILNAVQKCTGAKFDIPNGAGEIRFFDTIGPLPVREVLSTLLTATGYNFVIQSSDSEPGKVESVLLMTGAVGSADTAGDRSLTPARRAFLKMRQDALTEAGITDDSSSSTPAESPVPTAVQPSTAGTDGAAPGANTSSDANQAATASPSTAAPAENATSNIPSPAPAIAPPPSQPNTVEDQITNMQQMFEQRRQMMQPQPSTPPQ
jgi:hypothetical protein